MQLVLSLFFLTFGSASCVTMITLTEADHRGDVKLPIGESIYFTEYQYVGGGGSGRIVKVTYQMTDYSVTLVLKLVSEKDIKLLVKKMAVIRNEFKILQYLREEDNELRPAGIIRAFGYGSYVGDDTGCVLVLEHIASPNLNVLGFDHNASTQEILGTGRDLVKILEAAHKAGVVHLDIKPHNMLYAKKDLHLGVVLIDWETAEFHKEQKKGNCGTRAYTSPNVATGGVHGPDDDLRSVLYTLARAGFKGTLPWEVTSITSAVTVPFRGDINKKKEDFEATLENQKLDPELIRALVAIRTYLQSPRVPGKIDYKPIRKIFHDTITIATTRNEVTWTSYVIGLYNKLVPQVLQPAVQTTDQ